MVRATNNYACPYVYATISCPPHFLLKATILYICYELKLLEWSSRTTLMLSSTRELDRVPSTK